MCSIVVTITAVLMPIVQLIDAWLWTEQTGRRNSSYMVEHHGQNVTKWSGFCKDSISRFRNWLLLVGSCEQDTFKLFLTKKPLTMNLGFVIRENMWWVVPRLCLFESFSSTSTLLDPIFSCSVTTAAKCNYEISISCVSQTITNVKTIGSFNMTYFEKGHIRHTYM